MQDIFTSLNDRQREAVLHTEGPLLILAGAGAGKTRVLTHRIAYLIEEKGVAPYHIMAITFTNKAAGEMKERVQNLVPYGDGVWVATFHATCVRILRRHISFLGYGSDFTIYDTDDQKTVVKNVLKELNYDPKMFKERAMVAYISSLKNAMTSPEDALKDAGSDFRGQKEARIYEAYEKKLKQNNALDFDDLLLKTVALFETYPEVLENWQNRFRYIMVDEYQDTNTVQFRLVSLLAKKHRNLCVVGDDDQSIYRFRGADIRNILEFEKYFPETKVVKLEQNYRSTTGILDAANAVIRHNAGRKEKRLWSELGKGDPVAFRLFENGQQEAEFVVRKIREAVRTGKAAYKDCAVLYRTNAQSRLFEERCLGSDVPYRIVGGVNFYQRQEIKDLLAYLKTIANGQDDLSTRRILNVPRRGIGDTTIARLEAYAADRGLSLMEAIRDVRRVPGADRAAAKIEGFARLIAELRTEAGVLPDGRMAEDRLPFDQLIKEIVRVTDYESTLEDLDEEKRDQKKENIAELESKAREFEETFEGEGPPTLTDFLENVALVADIDSVEDSDDRVLLMTIHGSKGLEFPYVFLCGMEEGLFPSFMSIDSGDPMDMEEERRLCYVGITRAKRHLFLSAAKCRVMHGDMIFNKVSRFVQEIPEDLLASSGDRNGSGGRGLGGGGSFAGYGGSYDRGGFAGYGGSSYDRGGSAGYGSPAYGGSPYDRVNAAGSGSPAGRPGSGSRPES
ncbi:MAG: UvrD-helicase domain-containing protein, partial [Lachnospiraceae bacterium]|nr:UvrD-helicase domain-containing protein [Lachnospiraceae bacterium]